ncbi:hypothetical protein [Winogradskyella haliclonae]|uniref:Uncharacterized protein n=1 Tax=Winogradskyella haliclonae TaxID=2048558 RepID=A0ABQ2BX32_9FLAO|nr:hypothetical protein [Winogradskyella haliclonae]GGI57015.1 hypothetical protein GCM10011444_13240 [Winogradskyella haliclonae]
MKNNISNTGKTIALVSFVIGTIFLAFYLYYGETVVNVFLAFLFVVAAIITNTVVLTVIIGAAILNRIDRLEALKTIAIILLNIPIAILYFYMIISFPGPKFLL